MITHDKLTQLVQARLDPAATVERFSDAGGYGLVLWTRPAGGDRVEYIVHRWAAVDTAGEEIPHGGMFYGGGYHLDRAAADHDYDSRPA